MMAGPSMGLSAGENCVDGVDPPLRVAAKYTEWFRPGVISSLLLHALAAYLLITRLDIVPRTLAPVVPVDVVQLAEETISPPPLQKTAGPQQKAAAPAKRAEELASLAPPTFRPPTAPAPAEPQPPPEQVQQPRDELQLRLEALAKLRQPETGSPSGTSGRSASNNGTGLGPGAAYSVKDLVRAQVERRWNLDLDGLGARNFVIAIHVVLTRDGVVNKAEIVDQLRFNSDAIYRSIALSARNAVLLSSPILLPNGAYDDVFDMTLNLNPRDALR
jgi:hypothetical protein